MTGPLQATRIGGPTVLVEFDGWRILIDPTFDPPGRRYAFGLGTSSVKTAGPAVAIDDIGPLDLVLVSHDHHADNLDTAGRVLLDAARAVVTTASGAGRLGMPHVTGLVTGDTTRIAADGKPALEITATPCRHGPPLTRPLVGDVIGFAAGREGERRMALWVSGDTVLTRKLRATARELDVDVAIVNAGGVRFDRTGPLRYTMTGRDVVRLLDVLRPRVAIPAHYDGWSHFVDGERGLRDAVSAAPPAVRDIVRWLPDGQAVTI